MILVDTSIWIDHLNRGNYPQLEDLLVRERIVMHPYVIGEIALGSIKRRPDRIAFLNDIHSIPVANHAEVMALVEAAKLHGTGLGYVDANLLASVSALGPDRATRIWTRDERLNAQAQRLGLAYRP